GGTMLLNLVAALGRAGFLLAVTLILSRRVMPRFLHLMASSRSQETVLLATLTLCLGLAWVSHLLGVSYALGAFLAGLILGGTEYAHQHRAVPRHLRRRLLRRDGDAARPGVRPPRLARGAAHHPLHRRRQDAA